MMRIDSHYNSKTVLPVFNKRLGIWSKTSVNRSIQIPFQTPNGAMTFEIPIFDNGFHNRYIMKESGFHESTRILVADDSQTTRLLLRDILSIAGYWNVEEAHDGEDALSKLMWKKPGFELLIADWHMPNLTGLGLLRKMRTNKDLAHIPIILATGERDEGEVKTAIREGVWGYVVKPYEDVTLLKAMKRAYDLKQKKKKAA